MVTNTKRTAAARAAMRGKLTGEARREYFARLGVLSGEARRRKAQRRRLVHALLEEAVDILVEGDSEEAA